MAFERITNGRQGHLLLIGLVQEGVPAGKQLDRALAVARMKEGSG
jgi:hypothetical protein